VACPQPPAGRPTPEAPRRQCTPSDPRVARRRFARSPGQRTHAGWPSGLPAPCWLATAPSALRRAAFGSRGASRAEQPVEGSPAARSSDRTAGARRSVGLAAEPRARATRPPGREVLRPMVTPVRGCTQAGLRACPRHAGWLLLQARCVARPPGREVLRGRNSRSKGLPQLGLRTGRQAPADRSALRPSREHGPRGLRVARCCVRRSPGQGMLRWLALGSARATLHGHGSKVSRRPAPGLDGNTLESHLAERSLAVWSSDRRAGACRSAAVRHGSDDLRVGWRAFVDHRSDGARSSALGLGRRALDDHPARTCRPARSPDRARGAEWPGVTTRAPGAKLVGGAPMATSGRGVEGECPEEDRIPGEHRATPPATRRWRRNGLVPGSKALKSTPRRRLRPAMVAANHVVCATTRRAKPALRSRRRAARFPGGTGTSSRVNGRRATGAERRHGSGRGESSEGKGTP